MSSTPVLQACIGAFAWFLLGFGFAYDSDGDANSFIGAGKSNFALSGDVYDASETNGCAPPPLRGLGLTEGGRGGVGWGYGVSVRARARASFKRHEP